MVMLLSAAHTAWAADDEEDVLPNIPHATCTTDPQFRESTIASYGLITRLVNDVKTTLGTIQAQKYSQIATVGTYIDTLRAAAVLYICLYGMLFTFGIVQTTIYDFTTRIIKLGIIIMLFSGDSWSLFNDTFVKFFNDGTDEWIGTVSAAVIGGSTPSGQPFSLIDQALSNIISTKTAVNLMAMFFTPPYGPIIGILLALGFSTFIKAILQAAWVYLMSLIVKCLLFGLAPIFLACILFQSTFYLFTGWLNQIINASLQPIMLFTFLAFFVEMVKSASANLMETPVCWTEWGDSLRGSPFSVHYWRYALCEGGECHPYSGKWGFNGPEEGSGPVFPIPIFNVLVIVLISDLCARFNSIVTTIASELAGASMNLAYMSGPADNWFKTGGQKGDGSGGGRFSAPNTRASNASPSSAVKGAANNAAAAVGVRRDLKV